MAMGFDGIDFRLQSHSSMVSDYANYGFNTPILERFRQIHGVEKPGERPDPLKIMNVRGEFFQLFFTDAARVIHEHGRKVQVHLRNCYEDPKLGSDHLDDLASRDTGQLDLSKLRSILEHVRFTEA